jgi:ATP-dependent Lon protease
MKLSHPTRLPADALRWRQDEASLDFESTAELDPAEGVVGQPVALEAMRFGIECDAPAQNIYVRGLTGTGRMTLVQSLLRELKPRARRRLDRCYVHNFAQPDRPRLITLTAGAAPKFRRDMREAAEFIENRLGEVLEGPAAKARRERLQQDTQQAVAAVTEPLEEKLRADGLTLAQVQAGPITRTAIFALRDGQPVPPDQLRKLVASGEIDREEAEALEEKIGHYAKEMEEVGRNAAHAFREGVRRMREFVEEEIRAVLDSLFDPLREAYAAEPVAVFIGEVIEDAIENRLPGQAAENLPDATDIYGVNVIRSHEDEERDGDGGPVIVENSPSVAYLLGGVEPDFVAAGRVVTNYKGIRAGSLVRADGGFLVLDANDVLTEPGAWRLLMRTLRTRSVEIVPAELSWPLTGQSLKPEPIDLEVRVILLGSGNLFYLLDQVDQDFSDLFKVLADFDPEIPRLPDGAQRYAGVVARLCAEEGLPPFSAGGVAALTEHGARMAAREGKISARFGRLADIVREAAFLARQAGRETVGREQVEETVRRTRYRASLPSQKFGELVAGGVLRIQTSGEVVGQVNGLAVIQAGAIAYGFPARLTATVGAGRAGVIDIEGAAALSGSIHTKGFHILGGLLRFVLRAKHPLAFSASIAFEQSYGMIDGDSASGAEFCCLLSAVTGVPIRQGIAMTGAIDQHGHIQAIGGVNEKVDGYFDACKLQGLTGEQGVIIPRANAGDLMLRDDVVQACAEDRFHVFAVSTIAEALEVLTGLAAGDPFSPEPYAEDCLFARAQRRAAEFLRMSSTRVPLDEDDNGPEMTDEDTADEGTATEDTAPPTDQP